MTQSKEKVSIAACMLKRNWGCVSAVTACPAGHHTQGTHGAVKSGSDAEVARRDAAHDNADVWRGKEGEAEAEDRQHDHDPGDWSGGGN